MLCTQCKNNLVKKFPKLKICNSCYVINWNRNHPEKRLYAYCGNSGKAYIRDNKQCVACGSKKNIVIHHIDKNRKNHSLNNLITLCRSCHDYIHCEDRGRRKNKGQWSIKYNCCKNCGTKKTKHVGRGYCINCYHKLVVGDRSEYKKRWYKSRGKKLRQLRILKRAIDIN